MKKSIATIIDQAILGFLALGITFGLIAGCADVLGGPSTEITNAPAGTGRVLIRLGSQTEGTRTFMPTAAAYDTLSYTYTFTSEGNAPISGALTGGTATADMTAGIWDLTVEGRGGDVLILNGTVTGIVVNTETSTPVSVRMKEVTEPKTGNGTLNYAVSFPVAVSKGTLTIYGSDNDEKQGTPVDLAAGPDTDSDPDTKTVTGTIAIPSGQYRVALDLYKADGVLSMTDIAHIYPYLTTEAPYTIAAADFTPATLDSAQTSLAEVLGSVSALASGAYVTYVLPAGHETMSAAVVSHSSPVTVTIDGGGREVTRDTSGGYLITVDANVTLVLKNITLKGLGSDADSKLPLIRVAKGGTLEIGTGVLITDNRSSISGGGVYVISGIFTMRGGNITGNTSATSGGGVYVTGGTFTMHGGNIAGNTASATSGGGVSVTGGTFTMHGGNIAGNVASSSGGGVSVSGTFTMSGGNITGNTAAFSGGGVYIDPNGTFTKSGQSTIYGDTDTAHTEGSDENTAGSGDGHAVYVESSPAKKRNATAGPDAGLDSGTSTNWE